MDILFYFLIPLTAYESPTGTLTKKTEVCSEAEIKSPVITPEIYAAIHILLHILPTIFPCFFLYDVEIIEYIQFSILHFPLT